MGFESLLLQNTNLISIIITSILALNECYRLLIAPCLAFYMGYHI